MSHILDRAMNAARQRDRIARRLDDYRARRDDDLTDDETAERNRLRHEFRALEREIARANARELMGWPGAIDRLLEVTGKKRSELAEELGITRFAVQKWIAGDARPAGATRQSLVALLEAAGIAVPLGKGGSAGETFEPRALEDGPSSPPRIPIDEFEAAVMETELARQLAVWRGIGVIVEVVRPHNVFATGVWSIQVTRPAIREDPNRWRRALADWNGLHGDAWLTSRSGRPLLVWQMPADDLAVVLPATPPRQSNEGVWTPTLVWRPYPEQDQPRDWREALTMTANVFGLHDPAELAEALKVDRDQVVRWLAGVEPVDHRRLIETFDVRAAHIGLRWPQQ